MADGWQEARKASNLDGKKIRRYEGKLFTLKSLSSNPPTLLSSKHPSPKPSPMGEAELRHSEAQRAERIQLIMANRCQEVRRSSWYNLISL